MGPQPRTQIAGEALEALRNICGAQPDGEHLRSRGWVALLGDDGRGEEWKAFPRYIRHVLKKTGECSQCRKQFNKEPSKGVEAYISLLKKYSSMFSLYIVG